MPALMKHKFQIPVNAAGGYGFCLDAEGPYQFFQQHLYICRLWRGFGKSSTGTDLSIC